MSDKTCQFHRRGFALLMSLTLVAVAAAVLGGVASRSAVQAMATRTTVENVQQRWARVSLRSSLLPRVELYLRDAEEARRLVQDRVDEPPLIAVSQIGVACRLHGSDYELVLTDEQTRLNVNLALEHASQAEAERWVRQLISDTARSGVRLAEVDINATRRRGSGRVKTDPDDQGRLSSFAQVCPHADGEALLPLRTSSSHRSPAIAAKVTCWGNGKLNFRRAPDDVMTRVLGKVVPRSTAHDLVRSRTQASVTSLDQWLDTVPGLSRDERGLVLEMVTDKSSSFGLWIVQRDTQRNRVSFVVKDAVNYQRASSVPESFEASSETVAPTRHDSIAESDSASVPLPDESGGIYEFQW